MIEKPVSLKNATLPSPHQRPLVKSTKFHQPSRFSVDSLEEAIRNGCRWLQDVAQLHTDKLPEDTSDLKGFKYRHWDGALRGEYQASDRRWWFTCPVWHTAQAAKALLLASRRLDEPYFLDGAKRGAAFIYNQQVWDKKDPDHGLLLAYEDLADQVNTSAVMESLDGLMLLADYLNSSQMWERIIAAGDFVIERMYIPCQGVFRDLYSPSKRRPMQTIFRTKNGVEGRPLLEDAVLLSLYDRTGEEKFLDAHLKVSERLVADQNPPGNWIDYGPCNASLKRFHPRHTYWWALPLIETYNRTGRAEFLETAVASGNFCRRAMRSDGGYFRDTYEDFRTDSFGHETSGSVCAAMLFLKLWEATGDRDWLDPAEQAIDFCIRAQFCDTQDPNLKGAILEKLLPPDGTDRSLYYLRDLGTIFFVMAGIQYLNTLDSLRSCHLNRPLPSPSLEATISHHTGSSPASPNVVSPV